MARKQKTIHYIYKTTCLITGRYYVGMHSSNKLNDTYMGSGKRLRYSIRKHGIENHTKEILEYFESRELLIEAEKNAITPDMITDNNCMNMVEGGGGFTSEYAKICVKQSHEKQALLMKDKAWVEKKSNKISTSMNKQYEDGLREVKYFHDWTNKKHSDETKKLLSDLKQGTGIGETNSQYGTCWITKDGINKKINKEEIDKYQLEGWVKGRK
jgi:hypothetical protein